MNTVRNLLFDNNINFIEYHQEINFSVNNISYEIIYRNNNFYLSSTEGFNSDIFNLQQKSLINWGL